jgi:hypothetical protein
MIIRIAGVADRDLDAARKPTRFCAYIAPHVPGRLKQVGGLAVAIGPDRNTMNDFSHFKEGNDLSNNSLHQSRRIGRTLRLLKRGRVSDKAEDTERQPRQSYSGPPATLGSTLTANARVIVMCRRRGHEAEADLKHQILRHGAELSLPEWGARLVS